MTLSESYVPYCGVTIKSLIDTNKDLALNIHILSLNITNKSKNLLRSEIINSENIHIHFLEISEKMQDTINTISSKLPSHFNIYFILRLFADRILSESIDKILYVDVDTIFTDSIKELDDYTFNPSISMAAVKDLVRPDDYTRLGLTNPDHIYI